MRFKRDLALQNIPLSKSPSKRNPKLKTATSLEVLNIICPSQEPTSEGHVTTRSRVRELILNSSHCIGSMYSYNSCTSLIWVLHFLSIFLDWRIGIEPGLQLKGWILRALQNEAHMRGSILNTGWGVFYRFLWSDRQVSLTSWTLTGYFLISIGPRVTSGRFFPFIGPHVPSSFMYQHEQ